MSSPAPSNISQNNTEILKKQRQEMQQRHEEQQQLLAQLEEAAKLCQAECTGQKARRKAEAKAKAESCRGGGEEEEDKGVPPATSGWGARGRGHPIGGGWKIPGHRVLLYTSPSVQKQCLRGKTISEPYKSAFYGGHLFCNMSHGGAATFQIFHLPRQRYSYSTQSSMMELLLSVSQH